MTRGSDGREKECDLGIVRGRLEDDSVPRWQDQNSTRLASLCSCEIEPYRDEITPCGPSRPIDRSQSVNAHLLGLPSTLNHRLL